jgi:hypothetical protein
MDGVDTKKNILMKNKASNNKYLMGCKLSGQSSYQEKYNG